MAANRETAVETPRHTATTDQAPALPAEELLRTIDIICRDSGLHPDRYLRETTVPHGGE